MMVDVIIRREHNVSFRCEKAVLILEERKVVLHWRNFILHEGKHIRLTTGTSFASYS